eukprot:scaffold3533_cov97-Cylindrotheca_fusiformis.AAC.2
MDRKSRRLRYAFVFTVWLVICRIFWDVGLITKQGSLNKHKFEDLVAFAPALRTTTDSNGSTSNQGYSKEAIQADHIVQGNYTLTAEQEQQLKDLIDFTLGDEIEREDVSPEEIQKMLSDAINDAQKHFTALFSL